MRRTGGGSPARLLPVRWLLLSQPLEVSGLGLLGSDRVSVHAPPAVGVVGGLFRRQPGSRIVLRALAHPVRVATRPGRDGPGYAARAPDRGGHRA